MLTFLCLAQPLLTCVVRMEITPTKCRTGDSITLTEVAPATLGRPIVTVSHDALLIGQYDRSADRVVLARLGRFTPIPLSNALPGLPINLLGPHGIPLGIDGVPRGLKFDCVAGEPGMYLVTTKWEDADGRSFGSRPVVVTVLPCRDAAGRPILEPGWFPDPTWSKD